MSTSDESLKLMIQYACLKAEIKEIDKEQEGFIKTWEAERYDKYDPLNRMYEAVENGASVRYTAGNMMPSMKDDTEVDLTDMDCVHHGDMEYWVPFEAFEQFNEDGTLSFKTEDGKEIEPVLVRPIP